MRITTIIVLMILGYLPAFAQDKKEMEGVVTYVTVQNIYVKFPSAKGIKPGDKIFVRKDEILLPIMLVENVSSVSCVGKIAGSEKILTGDKVIALVSKADAVSAAEEKKAASTPVLALSSQDSVSQVTILPSVRRERIDGRIQISSYSNFSSLPSGNNNRLRYLWSMNAANLGNSRISFDSYISFSHKLDDWAAIQENIFNGLKIYDLNVRYEANANTTIWLGRKINPRISNIGAIDGVQFEVTTNHFYWGAVAGFRPDYSDYSFNKTLFEFGAFAGHMTKNNNGVMQTSLAVFNQSNSGNTDRRFVYLQHDNSLMKNLNLFFSSEVDLYKVINGAPVNELTLTSLYILLNYRVSKKLSLSTSYDNRKNIIYYETYKNYIDVMLADATRQGVQLRVNYRPVNYLSMGVSTSYWDRSGDSKPTKNINGFLTYAQLPFLKASASLNVNALQTSYVDGMIYGVRIDKDFVNGKLNWGLNYRYVDYTYVNNSQKLLEHIAATDLSMQFSRKFSLSVSSEGTFEKLNTYHQIYCTLIKRF